MSKRIHVFLAVLTIVALFGATAAVAGERAAERRRARGLKALGFKVDWSLLRDDQKDEAKEIIAEFLTDTAPDRLAALGRLVQFKADVAALLTPAQRREAARMHREGKQRTEEERRALADRLLSDTDRQALAARVERLAGATPEQKVTIGVEILDQVVEVIEPKVAERLALTTDQRDRLRTLYEELKVDLRPTAIRLETAKAEAVRQGVALLDDDQRAKLETFRDTVMEKVLAFLRG
jgi:hypothetical protein